MISKIGPILKSTHLSASRDAPHFLDLLASHAVDLVVHVERRADVIRNNAEPIADAVTFLGMSDIQNPVLLGKPFNNSRVIFLHETKAHSILCLVTIGRERLRSAIDYRMSRNGSTYNRNNH